MNAHPVNRTFPSFFHTGTGVNPAVHPNTPNGLRRETVLFSFPVIYVLPNQLKYIEKRIENMQQTMGHSEYIR